MNGECIFVWICVSGIFICFIAATILMILWHKSDKKMEKLLK